MHLVFLSAVSEIWPISEDYDNRFECSWRIWFGSFITSYFYNFFIYSSLSTQLVELKEKIITIDVHVNYRHSTKCTFSISLIIVLIPLAVPGTTSGPTLNIFSLFPSKTGSVFLWPFKCFSQLLFAETSVNRNSRYKFGFLYIWHFCPLTELDFKMSAFGNKHQCFLWQK